MRFADAFRPYFRLVVTEVSARLNPPIARGGRVCDAAADLWRRAGSYSAYYVIRADSR